MKMRKARILVKGNEAGILYENLRGESYSFIYNEGYRGVPVSLTMPVSKREYNFRSFPPYFDGLLPEGFQLEGLLASKKIDRRDYFSQLIEVGGDMTGAVTVFEITE